MKPETGQNDSTQDAEGAEAAQTHSPDRPATPEEAEAAERGKALSDGDQKEVAEHGHVTSLSALPKTFGSRVGRALPVVKTCELGMRRP